MKLTRFIYMLPAYLAATSIAFALGQQHGTVRGTVTDEEGMPIPYVNVFISGTTVGTITNGRGEFTLITPGNGECDLVASAIGFQRFSTRVAGTGGKEVHLEIRLVADAVKADEIVVTGSSYGSEKGKGVVLSSMDVVTTPGGAADVFQSLKTLPGLTQVSESAELYVRGGDPVETVTMIDQAAMYHPYTFESAYGGIFSTINTATINGMYFSSGGFSAKYGNVLSGVLDIDTKDQPELVRYSLGVSLANASVGANIPFNDGRSGIRVTGRQTFTNLLFWMNGESGRFARSPMSRDGTLSLTHRYSETGRMKLFTMMAEDRQGVNVGRPEYQGVFDGSSSNILLNGQLKDFLFSHLAIKTSVSFNRYTNSWKYGILDLRGSDEGLRIRSDVEAPVGSLLRFLFGAEAERRTASYRGIVPVADYNIRPEASGEEIDASLAGLRYGAYVEAEVLRLFGSRDFFGGVGVRGDRIAPLNLAWIDPRGTLGWRVGEGSTIRFGTGVYHQLPDPRLFAGENGNPDLGPMTAIHYVLSYDYSPDEMTSLKVEAFHKSYSDLPLEHPTLHYDNSGSGFARGIDLIAKGNIGILSGWVSYGYLDSKRRWMDFADSAPSSYDITHNFSIVAKINVTPTWQVGVTYKNATGRPYTEIIGARYHAGADVYEPIEGPRNGSRFPAYRRLDLRLTHLTRLFGGTFAVIFVEGLNILNIGNMRGYNYSPDYSRREEERSYFGKRFVVVGMEMSM